jgi:hypothetical protein
MYDLAHLDSEEESKNHIILYMQGKGMFNQEAHLVGARTCTNFALTNIVVANWRLVLGKFSENSKMQKSGFMCTITGFIWYNYYFVRSSYIKTLVRPILTSRRHYYEDYLSLKMPGNESHYDFRVPGEEMAAAAAENDICLPLSRNENFYLNITADAYHLEPMKC